ncbi:MAG TPA: PorV/PorQ family protein, partial [Chitinophaga sp.]|nr:PorV/PorQ family protein [Chitinophaga sp.]
MRQLTLRLAAFVLPLIGTITLKAQDKINVVTTAVPFLRISPDARAGGMGEIGLATAPDANSSFWNLAKTSFNTSPGGIGLTYTPWLKRLGLNDVYLATLAGYYKLDEEQAIAGSLRYFSLGDIQFTNGNGDPLNTYRPREFSVDAGYTRKLSENIGLGVALRYINSSLAQGTVNGTN